MQICRYDIDTDEDGVCVYYRNSSTTTNTTTTADAYMWEKSLLPGYTRNIYTKSNAYLQMTKQTWKLSSLIQWALGDYNKFYALSCQPYGYRKVKLFSAYIKSPLWKSELNQQNLHFR